MIQELSVLALIPARGGSKGIKNKNIADLNGKPLIAYTIEAAKRSAFVDDIVVTTDSKTIAEVAERCGARVPFLRPTALAQDKSTTVDAVVHALETLKDQGIDYDNLLLLQPTSPLRTTGDIDGALSAFVEQGCHALASVSEVSDHPLLIRSIEHGRMQKLLPQTSTCRRQDMPAYYRVNGSIYINLAKEVTPTTSFNDNLVPFIMEHSHSVDIDEPADLMIAGVYLSEREKHK